MSDLNRREFISTVATCVTTASLATDAQTVPVQSQKPAAAIRGLAEPAFRPLPLGAIRPSGWLQRQLRLQADGLSGHLDEFWPDVGESQWFGGKAEGWERAPYWLDGVIPLAWILDDGPLKARVARHVDFIVSHQRADGWYGPYPLDAVTQRYDMWAILLANKALVQYHEATGDGRVLDAVSRSLRALLAGLDRTPLYDWGKFRWHEGLVATFYVYEHTREAWLLDLARKLRAQGVDFEALYGTEDITVPTPRRGLWKWTKHVVNTAMATKAAALSWRIDQRPSDRAFAAKMIELLDRHHGQVTGMFTGDECLAGRNPLQGTELCAVVEFLYSLEHLFAAFGDPAFGDRLEQVGYNALPATLAPDMWSHQYDQQVNQVQCTINPDHMWSTNGSESNLFGLEPNYGCCTANMHQGWPKLAAHLWMKTPDEGIAAVAYAPSLARFESRGVPVTVSLDTDYPFREALALTVTPASAARFPLVLRVPQWAEGATARVGDGPAVPLRPGTLHRIEREWHGAVQVAIRFPMRAKITTRYNESVAVERGPLVYALRIGEEWRRVNADKPHRELPHGDFEVHPTTPWNYGLAVGPYLETSDSARPDPTMVPGRAKSDSERYGPTGLRFEERPVGDRPFSPEGAGMVCFARARKVPGWKAVRGWAAELAPADVAWADPGGHESQEPLEDVALIPYGCTNIRITEFPRVKG